MARPSADALALAARELTRLAVEQIANAQDVGGPLDARLDVVFRELTHLQAERHVAGDAHVRIERVVLEHHGDVPIHRRRR